jgi:hypothetical protein
MFRRNRSCSSTESKNKTSKKRAEASSRLCVFRMVKAIHNRFWERVFIKCIKNYYVPNSFSRNNALEFYSGGPRFEFQTGHRLFLLSVFVVFFCPFKANAGIVPVLGHDYF